jgi:hypothetical protein
MKRMLPSWMEIAAVSLTVTTLLGGGVRVLAQSGARADHNVLTEAEAAAGWIALFDGRTLTGWEPIGDPQWRVEDGTLMVNVPAPATGSRRPSGVIRHSRTFSNFTLKVDFLSDETLGSGIFFRCPAAGRPSGTACYEVNIGDTHDTWPTGSLVNLRDTLQIRPKTIGRWSTFEITAAGGHLSVTLNGQPLIEADDSRLQSGAVALQALGTGTIRFRNIKVLPLGTS